MQTILSFLCPSTFFCFSPVPLFFPYLLTKCQHAFGREAISASPGSCLLLSSAFDRVHRGTRSLCSSNTSKHGPPNRLPFLTFVPSSAQPKSIQSTHIKRSVFLARDIIHTRRHADTLPLPLSFSSNHRQNSPLPLSFLSFFVCLCLFCLFVVLLPSSNSHSFPQSQSQSQSLLTPLYIIVITITTPSVHLSIFAFFTSFHILQRFITVLLYSYPTLSRRRSAIITFFCFSLFAYIPSFIHSHLHLRLHRLITLHHIGHSE